MTGRLPTELELQAVHLWLDALLDRSKRTLVAAERLQAHLEWLRSSGEQPNRKGGNAP